MYTAGHLLLFDYTNTDINENANLPTHIKDKRLGAVCHTDSVFPFPSFSCLADWEARKADIRTRLLTAAGLIPMPDKCPLNARIFTRRAYDGFTVEKVVFESYPGFFVTGNLYRPISCPGKRPAVLNAHGHWENGRLERSASSDIPGRCANLALLGFVAFAYDMPGYNDSRQISHQFGGLSHQLWGMSGLGVQLWNSIRAVDFLASLADVDAARIACTGASGGASQVLFLAAADDRIKAVAAVNMVSAHFQGGCCCENAALLRIGLSNVEIAAAIAPRPLMVTGSDGDWTVNLPYVEYPDIHHIYSLYRQEANVEYFYQSAEHNYNQNTREAVYGWLSRLFFRDDEPKFEKPIALDTDACRIFGTDEIAPLDLFSRLKEARRAQLAALWTADPNRAVRTLAPVLPVLFGKAGENPAVPYSREETKDGYATRYILLSGADGAQVPAVIIHKEDIHPGKIAAVFHGRGKAAAIKELASDGRLDTLLNEGCAVASADLFLTGEFIRPGCAAGRDYGAAQYVTTFNQTDDAYRVSDAGLVLNHLRGHGTLSMVIGLDGAELITLAALTRECYEGVTAVIPPQALSVREDGPEDFFVPGFLGIGGIASCLNLCKYGGVLFCDSIEQAIDLDRRKGADV